MNIRCLITGPGNGLTFGWRNIKEGDKLPSEMKLKEMFDTSRGTIREALRVLEQKGLVSIRTGVKGGARVQAANTKPMTDSVAILIRQQKVSLHHLAEFRKMMEGHISEQAAKNVDKSSIKKLKAILSKAADHIQIYFYQYLPWSKDLLHDNFKDLCDIASAVEQKNPVAARKIAEDHVEKFNALMEKNIE